MKSFALVCLFVLVALTSAFELPEGKIQTFTIEGGEVQVEEPAEEEVSSRMHSYLWFIN